MKIIPINIDAKAVSVGLFIFVLIALIGSKIENHIFWVEVAKERIRTGADSSFDVAEVLVFDKTVLFFDFLFRIFTYGIPGYIAAWKTRKPFSPSPFFLGVAVICISICYKLISDFEDFYNFPRLFLAEIIFSFIVCVVAGIIGRWHRQLVAGVRSRRD